MKFIQFYLKLIKITYFLKKKKPQTQDGEKSDEQPPDPNAGNKKHTSKAEKKSRKKERLDAAKLQQTLELQIGQVGQTGKSDQQVVQKQ